MGFVGFLHGLAETPFEEQAHRILEDLAGVVALAPDLVLAHPPRHAEAHQQQAQRAIKDDEQSEQGDDEQVQRDLGPPRREDQQHIAVVEARAEGNGHGRPEQDQDPEQAPHRFALAGRRVRKAA